MQVRTSVPAMGSTARKVYLVLVATIVALSTYAGDKEDIEKLRKEKDVLGSLLKLYAQNVSKDSDLVNRIVHGRDPLSKEELEKFETEIKKTGLIFARHREAMGMLRQTIRRYGLVGEENLTTREGLRRLGDVFQRIQLDLDRQIILEQVIKDREDTVRYKDAVIDEKNTIVHKLTMEKNTVNIAKGLAKSVPDWKKNAEEIKRLRGELPDRRLTEMVMQLSTFDKNLDGIVEKQESGEVVKAFQKLVGISSEFGIQAFDRNKDGKLSDAERVSRNRIFTMIALERLADLDGDGNTTDQEIKLLALAEVLHFNKLAERYAGLLATTKSPPFPSMGITHKDDSTNYKIQSIQSANSLLVGRSSFTLPASLYGVGLPKADKERVKAREYLVSMLSDNRYRIDHKSSGADARKTLGLLEKLSDIIITKISFVDTRVSTVFEFLKNQSRHTDPEGEGVSFVLYPELKPVKSEKKPDDTEVRDRWQRTPENIYFADDEKKNEPLVTMDLDNVPLSEVILSVAQVTGCTIEVDGGLVYVRLPHAKPRKKQDTLLQLSLYLPKKGRTINYLLIRNGLAPCSLAEVKTPAEKELIEAQVLAKKEKLGVWAK